MTSDRRSFLRQLGVAGMGAMLWETPGAFAEQLTRTPSQTEGPYYPLQLPLDADNDLLIVNNSITPAVGQITYLSGRILSASGEAVRNATMEIWQADNNGRYLHPRDPGFAARDQNFQGFGQFVTGSTGGYLFRTIKPGLYAGRTRHIHFKVKVKGAPEFTSQLYFQNESQNATDGVLSGIRDAAQRASVIVPFTAIENSVVHAIEGRFNIVLPGGPGAMESRR